MGAGQEQPFSHQVLIHSRERWNETSQAGPRSSHGLFMEEATDSDGDPVYRMDGTAEDEWNKNVPYDTLPVEFTDRQEGSVTCIYPSIVRTSSRILRTSWIMYSVSRRPARAVCLGQLTESLQACSMSTRTPIATSTCNFPTVTSGTTAPATKRPSSKSSTSTRTKSACTQRGCLNTVATVVSTLPVLTRLSAKSLTTKTS
jgi:hypothetical protein